MAFLYVSEYIDIDGTRQVPTEPPLASYTLANTGATTPSAAFDSRTTVIRLHTDSICSVQVGPPGTVATTTSGRMAANQTEYRGVKGGQIVAVILNT